MRFSESYPVFDNDREGKRRNRALLRAARVYAEYYARKSEA